MKYENFMDETGKNNKVFVSSYNGPFLNSESLIIEYEDVLEAPELFLLMLLIKNKVDFNGTFLLDEIYTMDSANDIINWYVNRNKQSLFENFLMSDGSYLPKEISNAIVTLNLLEYDDAIGHPAYLNFFNTLKSISSQSIVPQIIIFSKYDEAITKKVESRYSEFFGDKIIFSHGISLKEIISKYNISNNSTFVISDVNYITDIFELNLLEYSSILVPDILKYNYKNEEELIIPIEEYMSSSIFKINFFNNFF